MLELINNEKQYFPRFHVVNSTVLCIVNRKPSVLLRALHNYHSLFVSLGACVFTVTLELHCNVWSASPLLHFRIIAARAPLRGPCLRVAPLGREPRSRMRPPKTLRAGRMQKIRTRWVGDALRLSDTCARTCCASLWKKSKVNARCQKKTRKMKKDG